jgi:hypothetical protein
MIQEQKKTLEKVKKMLEEDLVDTQVMLSGFQDMTSLSE